MTTTAGKRMPIDPSPTSGGNVEVLADGRALVHGQPPMDAGDLYVSHFATCPDRDQWRR